MAKRITALILAGALAAAALSGCTGLQQNSAEAEAQAANRQYMSQVSAVTEELAEKLGAFDDAVAAGDAVTMRLTADEAFRTLDSLDALEAPDVLKEVQAGYGEGAAKLEEALNGYLDLYNQAEAAGDRGMNDATYAEQLAAVQATYDEGIAKLQETDQKASEL